MNPNLGAKMKIKPTEPAPQLQPCTTGLVQSLVKGASMKIKPTEPAPQLQPCTTS